MAIDSALKRKSISGILVPFFVVGVAMDATKPAVWRQAAGWSYAGIAASSVAALAGVSVDIRGRVDSTATVDGSVESTVKIRGRVDSTATVDGGA